MKLRMLIACAIVAVALPSGALAAQEAAERGSWFRLLFFAINFAIFVSVVARFAAPAIRKFFADHCSEIRGTIERADAGLRHAQDVANRSAARMAGLEAEKAGMVAELDAETAGEIARIRRAALTSAERIRTDAEVTASALAESAQRRLRNQMAAAATRIARDLILRNFQDADQKRLLEDFTDKLGQEAAA